MRFYKIECSPDNETIYLQNIDCKIHSSKKGSLLFSGGGDVIIPITSISINFMIIYRSLNKIMMNVTFDYCSSYEHIPPYVRIIFEIYKKYSSNLIHECPYEPKKRVSIENLPLEIFTTVFAVANFQKGDYKTVIDVRDNKEQSIIHVNSFMSISQKKAQNRG